MIGCLPALRGVGNRHRGVGRLTTAERAHLVDVFDARIFPVLTPLSVDPGTRFRTSRTSP